MAAPNQALAAHPELAARAAAATALVDAGKPSEGAEEWSLVLEGACVSARGDSGWWLSSAHTRAAPRRAARLYF